MDECLCTVSTSDHIKISLYILLWIETNAPDENS